MFMQAETGYGLVTVLGLRPDIPSLCALAIIRSIIPLCILLYTSSHNQVIS